MSATSNTQSSTDSELNVFLAALGHTGNERYVKNMDALANKAESAIQAVASMNGRRVDNVVVRGNFALEQALEERLDEDALPDVQYYSMDFRQVLDDEPETYDDNGDEKETQGARLTAEQKAADDEDASEYEDDQPIAQIVAEADLDDETIQEMIDALDTVDDKFDADEDEFSIFEEVEVEGEDGETRTEVRSDFDLRIREHRDAIPMGELNQNRVNRAKARARGKTDERVFNDYFDVVPTADAAVFLHDSTDRGMAAVQAARGQNPWVKYPSQCDGNVMEVSCNEDGDDIVDWTLYFADQGGELTEDQAEDLRERHSEDELERMDFSVEDAAEPDAAAAGAAGQPASAD